MSKIYPNSPEIATQRRVINFLCNKLGYQYLGNWENRKGNSNIEEEYLTLFLKKYKHSDYIISKAIDKLKKAASEPYKSLYDRNEAVYNLLRYGTGIKPNLSSQSIHVDYIDFNHPENNHFGIAEEVTVKGKSTKRPDIVFYINGIAIAVLELKRAIVSISEGIRQNLDNQKREFIQDFFTTMQLVLAGNDTQGLYYGTINTPERYYLKWKEENPDFDHNRKQNFPRTLPFDNCEVADNRLDCELYRLMRKDRLLELIKDFVIFDGGIKKVPRHNQYFGIKAAQKYIQKGQGGIIWHTQGSGKTLTMIWLARWIHENIKDSRVLLITDREELDKQIEKNFKKSGEEDFHRAKSARDLIEELNKKDHWLIGSLIHKFGRADNSQKAYDDFARELEELSQDFEPKGKIFVFVDECHRTQSGKLHSAMKKLLPQAVFIGFTGTPLLKKDKPTTLQIFGRYIHTYKYDEAVKDGVVLDLQYQARDVDMNLSSEEKIDQWFELKTKGLTDIAKAQLKQRWGQLRKLYSSKQRMGKIVADIIFDFENIMRLNSGRGNAMLVASSVYEACKYYEMFRNSGFSKVAIITSYRPNLATIKGSSTGEELKAENIKKFEVYRKMIADYFDISPDEAIKDKWIDKFETDVKKKFIEQPAEMKLLIVVDKLLTGFDAPSATVLYIDKKMQDHNLFQAICRVNRLDDKDQDIDDLTKDFGLIIDYRDLFNSLQKTITDYTSGAFAEYDPIDIQGVIKDRIEQGKKRLDNILEELELMIEAVEPPKELTQFIKYFVGENDNEEKQRLRLEFYKKVSSFVRAYHNIANELDEAGYSPHEQKHIEERLTYFTTIRSSLKLAAGDYVDLKRLDPAMRHLIDTYVGADESRVLADFQDTTLLELISLEGITKAIQKLPKTFDKEAIAETIEQNVRKLIIEKQEINPVFYEKMSKLLNDLIEQRKREVISYEEYLKKMQELTQNVYNDSLKTDLYPKSISGSKGKQAIYDYLNNLSVDQSEELTNEIHNIVLQKRQDGWRGNHTKTKIIKNAIIKHLKDKYEMTDFEQLAEELVKLIQKHDEY